MSLDPLGRDQAAIGAAGEPRALRAQQDAADRREDAVGGDQDIGGRLHAVLERDRHAIGVLLDADAAVREMHALGRHRLGEQRMQFAAMEDHVRRAEFLGDRLAERRFGQRAAIVPAALMKERRPERHPGAFLAEAEPDQNARCVRSDVDAGADFGEQP